MSSSAAPTLTIGDIRPGGVTHAAGMVTAASLTCAYCAQPGEVFFEHAFPWEHFSSPLLSSPLCYLHSAMLSGGVIPTGLAEYLPQLPAESVDQRMQRETETAQYATLVADPTSEAGRWAVEAATIRSRNYECLPCRVVAPFVPFEDDDEYENTPVPHSRAQLHTIREIVVRMPGSTASVTPVGLRCETSHLEYFCEEHIWDTVRLLQFFDPRANGGKGNITSKNLDGMAEVNGW